VRLHVRPRAAKPLLLRIGAQEHQPRGGKQRPPLPFRGSEYIREPAKYGRGDEVVPRPRHGRPVDEKVKGQHRNQSGREHRAKRRHKTGIGKPGDVARAPDEHEEAGDENPDKPRHDSYGIPFLEVDHEVEHVRAVVVARDDGLAPDLATGLDYPRYVPAPGFFIEWIEYPFIKHEAPPRAEGANHVGDHSHGQQRPSQERAGGDDGVADGEDLHEARESPAIEIEAFHEHGIAGCLHPLPYVLRACAARIGSREAGSVFPYNFAHELQALPRHDLKIHSLHIPHVSGPPGPRDHRAVSFRDA